jgi:hypothetical protein
MDRWIVDLPRDVRGKYRQIVAGFEAWQDSELAISVSPISLENRLDPDPERGRIV